MKSRTRGAGTNWTLDGETITVFIPMTWKRRGGRKVIIAPDGSDAWAPAKPRLDETLIRALARAHRWNRMLEAWRCRSIAEIAEYPGGDPRGAAGEGPAAGGVDGSGAGAEWGAMPAEWEAQRRLVGEAPIV